ncbi:hypothetical protein VHEMI09108 [[Torrubiella] hemipterigena]|uniref:Short-chain dehydrogenase n=1 Tax=[Torrubiella] hemipterigena TaxID=1531966 RepID=A0A0A1TQW5_9HYPO|nr:hypothetical protein VHEMI09108 [[Torrubiella] hemipterigena]
MCIPCGDFNLAAGSAFVKSPEPWLNHKKIAVITGGRVNLGFHLALNFLSRGFRVIVTTRYPQDALERYHRHFLLKANKNRDSFDTLRNLRMFGAEFRISVDVFGAIRKIKELISPDGEFFDGYPSSIYFLINNAAQTLTDSISKERLGIEREAALAQQQEDHFKILAAQHNYTPRVRGGAVEAVDGSPPLMCLTGERQKRNLSAIQTDSGPSSWAQRLSDIPYEDFISAHSVNTFTPLILIRELAPIMSTGEDGLQGHIVNVSSREGIFEARRGNTAKQTCPRRAST